MGTTTSVECQGDGRCEQSSWGSPCAHMTPEEYNRKHRQHEQFRQVQNLTSNPNNINNLNRFSQNDQK